jgi:hypothetical protein
MSVIAKVTAYHMRGLSDSGGSPGSTIATKAVDKYGDGSFRFSDGNETVIITDPAALRLLAILINVEQFGSPGIS